MEFTVLKTKLKISPLFFAVLTAFLLADKSGIAAEALLFSALHEAGHFLALICVKSRPISIELSPFGIHMSLPQNLSMVKKCFVLTAGFAVNFILFAVMLVIGRETAGYINLLIGIFTAMPLASADGGTVLKTLLDEILPEKSNKIFKIISFFFIAIVSCFIIIAFFLTGNYFLFVALIYIVICAVK